MKKAFIFDMDGVVIDTERAWTPYENQLFEDLVGNEIANRLPNIMGLSVSAIYDEVRRLGHAGSKDEFIETYHKYAKKVFKAASITKNTEKLIKLLQNKGFEIGIVSASPQNWIDMFLDRIPFRDAFKYIISLDNHNELRAKPHPDGYIAMMKLLDALPDRTIILEDSNYGIEAGKKSGAYVIGFKENLHGSYVQKGADVYVDTMNDVILIVKERIKEWESL